MRFDRQSIEKIIEKVPKRKNLGHFAFFFILPIGRMSYSCRWSKTFFTLKNKMAAADIFDLKLKTLKRGVRRLRSQHITFFFKQSNATTYPSLHS
jgi:hypothetical protein